MPLTIGRPIALGRFLVGAVNDSFEVAATPATLTAGRYFSTSPTASESMTAEFTTRLVAIVAGASLAFSATSGRFTLVSAAGAYTVTWTDTALRDLLGFTGATTVVGAGGSTEAANQARYVWRPAAYAQGSLDYLSNEGHVESAARVTRTMGGQVRHHSTNTGLKAKTLAFAALAGHKVWEQDDYANQSWERFWSDVITQGERLRWYPDERSIVTATDRWEYVATEETAKRIDARWLDMSGLVASLRIELHRYVS